MKIYDIFAQTALRRVNDFQISDYSNNIQQEQSEIKEKQLNYAINLFILHGIFTSFELRTKYL